MTPVGIALPRPVITSGIRAKVCGYITTNSAMMA
jgi:hypothetical protein